MLNLVNGTIAPPAIKVNIHMSVLIEVLWLYFRGTGYGGAIVFGTNTTCCQSEYTRINALKFCGCILVVLDMVVLKPCSAPGADPDIFQGGFSSA